MLIRAPSFAMTHSRPLFQTRVCGVAQLFCELGDIQRNDGRTISGEPSALDKTGTPRGLVTTTTSTASPNF